MTATKTKPRRCRAHRKARVRTTKVFDPRPVFKNRVIQP